MSRTVLNAVRLSDSLRGVRRLRSGQRVLAGLAWILSVAVPGVVVAAPGAPVDAESTDAPAEADSTDETDDADREVREVVVQTTDADGMSASGRTITPQAVANTPKRSAEDLLRLVPGMVLLQHGNQGKGAQFYLRGFDADHGSDVEVLLEDIPLNEPSNVHAHGYLDLSFIPAEAVYSLDATKGAFRLGQGNFATAGSIRYKLGVPRQRRGTLLSYEVGSTNRHRAVVVHAPKAAPESTFFSLEAMHDDGFGTNRRSQRVSSLSQFRLWSRGHAHMDALAGLYTARFDLPGTTRLDDFNNGSIGFYDGYAIGTEGTSSRALLGLSAGVDRERTTVGLTVYGQGRRLSLDENFTGFLLDTERGDRHVQTHDAGTLGARANVGVRVHPAVELKLLGSWQGDLIEQRDDQLLITGEQWGTTRALGISQNAFSLSPGLRTAPVDWLVLEGGVRADVITANVRNDLEDGTVTRGTWFAASPRFAARATVSPRWQLFGAYGRGFRSPEARSLTLPQGPQENVDLDRFAGGEPRMTLTDNAEVGARFRPSDLFDVGSSLFGIWIARESVFDHVSGFNVELSGTQRLGVEGDVQLHPTRWLDLGFDVTAVRGRFVGSDARIPGAPPLIVSTFGNLSHRSGWRAGWRWFLLGPRSLTYGARAGVMTVLDTSVGYSHRWFGVDLALDNILGLRWKEGEYNYASWWDQSQPRSQIPTIHYVAGYPRMVRLTLSARF